MRQWKMKLTAVLLALCCLVVVLPVHAQAAMVYTTVEEAVEALREAMVNREETIELTLQLPESEFDGTKERAWELGNTICVKALEEHTGVGTEGDYLRYQYSGYDITAEVYTEGDTHYVKLTVSVMFYTDAQQEAELDAAIAVLMEELNLEGKSDYKKVKAIYDQICNYTSYDYEHLEDTDYKLQYTAYAALVNHTAVCQGYANLFYRLALEAGLDARIVTGTSMSEPHAWNIVKVDGKYYNVDCTWDAGSYNGYFFFLRNEENFLDHDREEPFSGEEFKAAYPIAEEDYTPKAETFTAGDYTYSSVGTGLVVERYNGNAAHVTIPGSVNGLPVVEIGQLAFYDNDTVQTVTVPASVRSIADGYLDQVPVPSVPYGAFALCDSLQTVIFPEDSQLFIIGEWAFYESGLSSIELPKSIRTLSTSCLENTKLTELVLPEGLRKIEQGAIGGAGLKKLHMPASCDHFVESQDLPGLEAFTVAEGNPKYFSADGVLYSRDGEGAILILYPKARPGESYRVLDSCTSINAFATGGHMKYLRKLYIGNAKCFNELEGGDLMSRFRCELIPDATSPYYMAKNRMLFSKDGKMLIQVPSDLTGTLIIPEGVEIISGYAAEQGSYSKVIIPDSVTTIGDGAFWESENLEEIVIPDSVTYMGSMVFKDCTNLKRVTLSANLKELYINTFMDTQIETLILPEGMECLEWQALTCCWELKCLYIPVSMKYIGYDAISMDGNGCHVYYGGTEQQWKQIVVEDLNNYLTTAMVHYNVTDIQAHNVKGEIVESTCTEMGYTIYSCACGYTFHDDFVEMKEHDLRFVGVNDPDCIRYGNTRYYCAVCGGDIWIDNEDVPPLGHDWGAWIQVGDMYSRTCLRCGETEIGESATTDNPFTDVPDGKYYTQPILWAFKNGITTGKTADTFLPGEPCTRAQIVTFLWRAMGSPEPEPMDNPFTDIREGKYYYKAVIWAVQNGITTGKTATTFEPDSPCTRSQVVTFLWRTMDKPGHSQSNPFSDIPGGKYYTDAVLWALENGITTGKTATTFLPNDTCTRAQIVTFLYRTLVEG